MTEKVIEDFNEVCEAYKQRILAIEKLSEMKIKHLKFNGIRIGCLCLIVGLLLGSIIK